MMGDNSSQLHNNSSMSLLVVNCCSVASQGPLLSRRDIVGFHPTFSRHGIVQASLTLLIWLNENVGFHPTFSRHGIAQASLALLIWLNENVYLHCCRKLRICRFIVQI